MGATAGTSGASTTTQPVGVLAVEATGLRKVYGPTTALADANFEVRVGEIHGLLGENGAGKSTLVRILAGVHGPDAGTLRFFGEDATSHQQDHRRRSGIAVIHQDLGLFDGLSVADNIAMSCGFRTFHGVISESRTARYAEGVAARLGFDIDVHRLVGELPLADQTLIALCRALGEGARLIVLDEPTAYLEARQVRTVFRLLSRLRDEGVACVLVTHRSEDVLSVCDRVTVLRDGCDVARRDAGGLSEKELIRLITGRDPVAHPVEPAAATTTGTPGPARLEVRRLHGAGFGPVSFTVGTGEVVGLCGLADSGHVAVGDAVIGIAPADGDVMVEGSLLRQGSVPASLAAGVGIVPANRVRDGLASSLTASENLAMNPDVPWWRPLRGKAEVTAATHRLNDFRVRPADARRLVATFSGGNQQKILLSKWLGQARRLVVLNEPSAGVDLGAKAEIHALIRRESGETGTAVLVVSTDFQEIAELCDRALVMHRGVVVAELSRGDLTAETVTECAYGGVL